MGAVKYPKTYHFPWSQGVQRDDRTHHTVEQFEHQIVVATLKGDGENTTMMNGRVYARSVDSLDHPSRHLVKRIHGEIRHEIPDGWRICGENLAFKKSIHYHNLPAFFCVFNIWDERNVCLSWADTEEFCDILGLTTVPVLYTGVWDEDEIRGLYTEYYEGDLMEGYVVRIYDEFHYDMFTTYVGKFVRANHVQTDTHWMHQPLVPNELRG
jgi:hypothetical protein